MFNKNEQKNGISSLNNPAPTLYPIPMGTEFDCEAKLTSDNHRTTLFNTDLHKTAFSKSSADPHGGMSVEGPGPLSSSTSGAFLGRFVTPFSSLFWSRGSQAWQWPCGRMEPQNFGYPGDIQLSYARLGVLST
ncbi:uncharacterized protein J7T54_007133 [Emericellopsis cladophorae]|uniref:Uncharacterized protein n=1 Tax=Emericellopsis cladophorae TaxID=2686198 RepID=A0A9P9Y9J1_9HYPO|nr:uncharacterized protein J7T54_007133 [Emericellopsis cladophorae]KAI6785490.1 hypothetical protein J7T54_007133 [Emericellopsis cladophorae]